MESREDLSAEAQGLRLVRAFLLLPSARRAEVIALVEDLVPRDHRRPEEGQDASPT